MIILTETTISSETERTFFKILRKSLRIFFHGFHLRPGSAPYVTGDSFRQLADHIYDETKVFTPDVVKTGDIVFISSTKMQEFFTTIHPFIQHKYILVEHNGDYGVNEKIVAFMDDKIIRFYAQLVTAAHERIIPIPIGIENKHHGSEVFPVFIKRALQKIKTPRIFFHFSVQTNPPERGPALEYFKTHPVMDTINKFVPYFSYKKILASYAFTASPAGNTLGSHRTWEALYLRTIPIVKRTVDAEFSVAQGLPIWILDDWHELDEYDEAKLQTKYDTMMKTADYTTISMDYWTKRIKQDSLKAKTQGVQ